MEEAAPTGSALPTSADETGVYRRAEVEGFSAWARATIEALQQELAATHVRLAEAERRAGSLARGAAALEQRALDAEKALVARLALEGVLARAADQAAAAAAEAAAAAVAERVDALLDAARAGSRRVSDATLDFGRDAATVEDPGHGDDPIRDPLPRWDERLLAFPDDTPDLPPIGPIFGPEGA